MPYNRNKQPRFQKSYGYFRKVEGIHGYKSNNERGIRLLPRVSFAGDIKKIGLGQLIAIRYTDPTTKQKKVQFGILADTGGAFRNNGYQLDYFAGTYLTRKKFKEENIKRIPSYVEAFILVAK